jgi:hypothetical protein
MNGVYPAVYLPCFFAEFFSGFEVSVFFFRGERLEVGWKELGKSGKKREKEREREGEGETYGYCHI